MGFTPTRSSSRTAAGSTAEFVVLGVGVKPRIDLAKRAGLEVENGIVVDSRLRTSAPDVWAAGDVARYPEARLGTKIRVEHWPAAERQGQSVARGHARPRRALQ